MINLTGVKAGDMLLVNFPYEDNPQKFKQRPAVVIQVANNQLSVVALKVTSTPPRDKYDYELISWALAGLNRVSTVRTSKRAVIKSSAIIKVLGSLSAADFNAIQNMYATGE